MQPNHYTRADQIMVPHQHYSLVEDILVPHTAVQLAMSRIWQCYVAATYSKEPICLALIGPSRSGKSSVLENIESRDPQIRLDDGLIVPILRVSTPSSPTVKGLAEILLAKLGDPSPGKGTETNMTSRLITLLKAAKTKMIMIDEFQHFYDKSSHKVMHHVADWLKLLIDQSRVALVVSGLPSCQAVLNQNEQLAGRFLAPIHMPRFDWKNGNLREEFIAILGAFQEGLSEYDLPKLDSDTMAFRFYCASGGLIGYVAKILREAIWNAISANTNVISLEDLAKAHYNSVYAAEKAGDLPLAFDRSFIVTPTETLLQRVQLIGTATPEELPARRTRSKSSAVSISQVLRK